MPVDFYDSKIKKNKEKIEKLKIKSLNENSGVAFITFISDECVSEIIDNF